MGQDTIINNNDMESFLVATQHEDESSTEDLLFQYLQPNFVQSLSPPSVNVPEHECDTTGLVQFPVSVDDPKTPIGSPSSIHFFSQSQLLQQQEQEQQHYDNYSPTHYNDITTPSSQQSSPSLTDIPPQQSKNANIQLQINSFSDLQTALKDIGPDTASCQNSASLILLQDDYHTHRRRNSYFTAPSIRNSIGINKQDMMMTSPALSTQNNNNNKETTTTEEDLIHLTSTDFHVPNSIRLNVESSQMLDSLMEQAISHWCCIGFKVAPISLDLIRDWHNAPPAIVYCVASISLVTFMDHHTSQSFIKQAAIVFYEQARHKMDDVFVENMQPMVIQAYFCLSYTSNLLRLYEQQRTWGGLASIALQQHAKDIAAGKPVDRLTMMCWLRWYYVDAWMCLTLNRECLLADDTPLQLAPLAKQQNDGLEPISEEQQQVFHCLYQFASLTKYMRMYIRAIRTGTIFKSGTNSCPSAFYRSITEQLKQWYSQQLEDPQTEIHFHLCYHAMRLVILFQFLHPTECPPHDILIDCLETNLALLQALQHLKEIGCDQSTYHHMFFAIHNTAKRVYTYNDDQPHKLERFAKEQLCINLKLLRGTQAYINDLFKARLYAEKIEQQFRELSITVEQDHHATSTNSKCNTSLAFNRNMQNQGLSAITFSPSQHHHSHQKLSTLIKSSTKSFHPNYNNDNGGNLIVFRASPLSTPKTSRVRNKPATSSPYNKIKKESLKRQLSVTTPKASRRSKNKKTNPRPSSSGSSTFSTITIFQQQQCY